MKPENLLQRWLELWKAINRLMGRSAKTSHGKSTNKATLTPTPPSAPAVPDLPSKKSSNASAPATTPPEPGLSPMEIEAGQEEELRWRQELLETIHEEYLKEAQENQKTRKTQTKRNKARRQAGQMQVADIQQMLAHLPPKTPYTMLLFIMYDIQSNKVRKKVADYLEAKGLKRVQYSVFFGELDRRHYQTVKETLLDIQVSYENEDSIMVVPIAEDEFRRLHLIGKEVDFELDLMRGSTLIF